MEIPLEFVALIGVIVGVLLKTILPYVKKAYEDPDIEFNLGYLGTMIMSGIVSGALLFSGYIVPAEGEILTIFIAAVFFGAGVNGVFNYSLKSKIQG